MSVFGAVGFDNVHALWALALLPVIWWLLRFTPPRPDQIRFPPIRFLVGLVSREETPHKSPWWLTALRTVLAGLVIIAAAGPILAPHVDRTRGSGVLAIVLDDGWAAAADWRDRMTALENLFSAAERQSRPVLLATTSPQVAPQALGPVPAGGARDRAQTLAPRPYAPDRLAVAEQLSTALADETDVEVIWLSDGLDYGDADEFAQRLTTMAAAGTDLHVLTPQPHALAKAVKPPRLADGGLEVEVVRATAGTPVRGTVRALALNGRALGDAQFAFAADATEATARLELPLALRNEIARLEVLDANHAGAVYLVDDRWRRKTVGLVTGVSDELAQPLLSPLYYVERALQPYAEIPHFADTEGTSRVRQLLEGGLSVLVLADVGQLNELDREAVSRWVEAGGVLVRFAGPRVAGARDDLLPVRLHVGNRMLGGALSWTEPQPLSPFEEDSPFHGLTVPADVTVNRQVLAEPGAELSARTWARLADGTPLVTAGTRGSGYLVLFHVPASPGWSNLPMSGLFVEMLRRIVDMSQGTGGATEEGAAAFLNAGRAYAPVSVLDGFGRSVGPDGAASPIMASEFETAIPGPRHPPGLYRRGAHTRALNIGTDDMVLKPLGELPSGAVRGAYETAPERPLRGLLLIAALVFLFIDGIAVLAISGRLAGLTRRGAVAGAVGLALLVGWDAVPAGAQPAEEQQSATSDEFALAASLETRLAYVITGNSRVDDISLAGLTGLSNVLNERTALEPAAPIGIDVERDELVFFPLIYWPVLPETPVPSAEAVARLDSYLKHGGTILFDTRDPDEPLPSLSPDDATPSVQSLRRILSNLDVPPLEVVPPDHVLTKAFYLLQTFPGRWANGRLWVEAAPEARAGGESGSTNYDGVSSIIIGSNDYAAAWAVGPMGQPLLPTVPGGQRQRELAYRSGVNIVMYALTGNYKADQVHVPALLERLGQ